MLKVCHLCSGRDQLLPSQEEGEKLRLALSKCQNRRFDDSGHFLFLVYLLLSVLCFPLSVHVGVNRSFNQIVLFPDSHHISLGK